MTKRHEFIEESRKQWSSEPAFVFSMAAAAVGLGNLWRFPYMVGENGGGAFVVAYLLALVIVVLPIMILEVAAGRLSEGSTVQTFRQVNRFGAIYGWFVVLITMAITSYYLVITGWTLGYAVDAATDDLRVFSEYSAGYNSLWYFLIVTVLAAIILARDVKAIEVFSKMLMPVLLLVMIGLMLFASTTPGWEQTKSFSLTWTGAGLQTVVCGRLPLARRSTPSPSGRDIWSPTAVLSPAKPTCPGLAWSLPVLRPALPCWRGG